MKRTAKISRYGKLVNWLENEHNDVFLQWSQITAILDRKLEVANLESIERKAKYERERWEENKTKMQAFLDSEESNEMSEDMKKVIQFNLDIVGKEVNGEIVEPYQAWDAIRALMKYQPYNPIRHGGGME